ncbi:Asp-tRNA(Asn)/Glu-tRNA(Gln) amidotransferase subunit GatC [Candidatus Parcubacteria bacterium]|nr:Asp-tRNA(Asn)/Glu-tRNA(Gln) amidotransferase subunit GatC [Candidatus Parcubacteria bacterium]
MNFKKKEIEHIANLARLELSGEELDIYGKQLSDILGYIEQLQEVDTEGVEPTAQITGLENSWREDEARAWDDSERINAINQSPEVEEGQIKVGRVL